MSDHTAPTDHAAPTAHTVHTVHTAPAPEAQITFELALYRVRDADAFASRQHELHAAASGFDGYVTSWPMRADTAPEVFADVVQWRDGAAAAAAAEQFGQRPDLAWVGEAMTEMLFFGHLHTHDGRPSAPAGPRTAESV